VTDVVDNFALRPTLDWSVHTIGSEQTPVLVIDGVLQHPEQLVDYAAQVVSFDMGDDGSGGYPGVRAPAPLNYVGDLVRTLDPLMRDVFGLGKASLANAECSFSIVTTARENLHPAQCIPHIDTTYPLQFAILHYLCNTSFGGTAFFRQNATEIERVTELNFERYDATKNMAQYRSDRARDYVDTQDSDYSQIAAFDAAFDRLLIYPSCILHSGIIHKGTPLIADPRLGRLTSNIFVTYKA
jgi:Family of unknown function (DUF6445)